MKLRLLLILLVVIKTSHAQWVETYNFPENGFSNLYFFDESEGIVLQNDKIYKTYDSGESWSLVEAFSSDYFFWHMDFYGDTGIIVGSMLEIPSKQTPLDRVKLTPLLRRKVTPVLRGKLTPPALRWAGPLF